MDGRSGEKGFGGFEIGFVGDDDSGEGIDLLKLLFNDFCFEFSYVVPSEFESIEVGGVYGIKIYYFDGISSGLHHPGDSGVAAYAHAPESYCCLA